MEPSDAGAAEATEPAPETTVPRDAPASRDPIPDQADGLPAPAHEPERAPESPSADTGHDDTHKARRPGNGT
jgi:hypothetical protein